MADQRSRINVKEILRDIRSGMDDTSLMQRHQVSSQGLQSLFRKLVEAGLLSQSELDNRSRDFSASDKGLQGGVTGKLARPERDDQGNRRSDGNQSTPLDPLRKQAATNGPSSEPMPESSQGPKKSPERQWYDNPWILALLLICLFPVGFYALYRNTRLSRGIKAGIACAWLVLAVVSGAVAPKRDTIDRKGARPSSSQQALTAQDGTQQGSSREHGQPERPLSRKAPETSTKKTSQAPKPASKPIKTVDQLPVAGKLEEALCEAINNESAEEVGMILSDGAKPNVKFTGARAGRGTTPLHLALMADSNRIDMIAMLLKAGADPNILDSRGVTPLGECVYGGGTDLQMMTNGLAAMLLLKGGADPNIDHLGQPPLLCHAVVHGNTELAKA